MNFFHSQLHSCSCKLCKLPQLPQVDADTRVTVASLSCQLPKRSRQTAVRSACQDSQYANASSSLASYQWIDPLLPLLLPPSLFLYLSLSLPFLLCPFLSGVVAYAVCHLVLIKLAQNVLLAAEYQGWVR